MPKRKYDFAGWVTKNDILCSDGLVIRHGAFKDNNEKQVPLVWEHDRTNPENILGHVVLQHRDEGTYGYGYFNHSERAQSAKESVRNGDIVSMSIAANRVKKLNGRDVVHGNIYEVSLVIAAANPGAMIVESVQHSEGNEEGETSAIIYTNQVIHSAEYDDYDSNEDEDDEMNEDEFMHAAQEEGTELANSIIGAMTEEELAEVYSYAKSLAGKDVKDSELFSKLSDEQIDQVSDKIGEILSRDIEDDEEEAEDDSMKHNIFNSNADDQLKHSELCASVLEDAHKLGSLKEAMIQHSINNIDELLTVEVTSGAPEFIRPEEPSMVDSILAAVKTTPKHTIRGRWADLTGAQARAKGYVKGHEKFEESFGHWNRETHPQTIYKKQSLENDDIIDITDFDVVAWLRGEMREMWRYELARAIFIPDGREPTDPDKIKEDKIRPITTDVSAFVTQVPGVTAKTFIEDILTNKVNNYKGTGRPDMYMDEALLVQVQLLKDDTGKYLFGDILSRESLASKIGVGKIVTPDFLDNTGMAIMVNLKDYELAAPNKGRSQTYEDFDIDFNKHKYLIEGRVAGALNTPKSAIVFKTGANSESGSGSNAGQ